MLKHNNIALIQYTRYGYICVLIKHEFVLHLIDIFSFAVYYFLHFMICIFFLLFHSYSLLSYHFAVSQIKISSIEANMEQIINCRKFATFKQKPKKKSKKEFTYDFGTPFQNLRNKTITMLRNRNEN